VELPPLFVSPNLMAGCMTILCKCCNWFSYHTNREQNFKKTGSVCYKLVTVELNPYQGAFWLHIN
jgi:hypothetical protein